MSFDYNNYDAAKKLVRDFINSEFLNGDIGNLATFSFWALRGHGKYDNDLDKPDAACTKLAYAIDCLLYADILPEYHVECDGECAYSWIRNKATYSGETINTFDTLFSPARRWIDEPYRWREIVELYGEDEFIQEIYDAGMYDPFESSYP